MYDGSPGEIDFGSSKREVRVSEGSNYRESTVERRGMFNWSFLPMDSTNLNVLFRFGVSFLLFSNKHR